MSLPPSFTTNFPSYIKERFEGQIEIFYYHPDFSQSRYPPGQKGSQACTLICLFVAQLLCEANWKIWDVENCSVFNVIIAEAMIKGNGIHAQILEQGIISNPYLNIEEALLYGGSCLNILKEWKFRVVQGNIKISLSENIKYFLNKWYRNPKSQNLFMLLITCKRTILFIFQEKTQKITLFDPHGHHIPDAKYSSQRGLVVAQTSIERLDILCNWYVTEILINCFKAEASQYELAFLYNQIPRSPAKNCPCECTT